MKIVYECEYFIIVEHNKQNMKTNIYDIYSNYDCDLFLGSIKWYSRWRKYCFYAHSDIIWDNKCLTNVVDFLNTINKQHKELKISESKKC